MVRLLSPSDPRVIRMHTTEKLVIVALKIGLDQLFKILDLIPTDATCDEDSAFMKAMRELYPDLQFHRDWVHKGRHAEEYALRDCKDKKSLTDAEQLHVSKAN